MVRLAAVIAVLLPMAAGAQGSTTLQLANQLGSVLGAERGCGLKYDQAAVKSYIETKVRADDMQFPSLLHAMSQAAAMQLNEMSESQKTAYCAQITRVAKTNKFIRE